MLSSYAKPAGMRRFAPIALSLAALVACTKERPAPSTQPSSAAPASPAPEATAPETAAAEAAATPTRAEVGKPAPDFALKDLDGNEVRLGAFKGKPVVLEWFNPGCPFVANSHTVASLKGTAKRHAERGVAWLAINSAGPGKQGHGPDVNREAAKKFGMSYPILLDESGEVGKAYGATNTPHMFVIDAEGTLVYQGAIDNSPDGEGESPTGGKLVSYVDEALAAIADGKAPATRETEAYGCSVKFAE